MHVTVIIPTFNRAAFLSTTIESVLEQTYTDRRLMIIDDGSTDRTQEVVDKYRTELTYVYQENSERGAARNRGLKMAQGEYVAFLDSDDLWPKTHLERSIKEMENTKASLVWSDVIYMNAKAEDLYRVSMRGTSGLAFEALLRNNYINQSSVVLRRSCLDRVGLFCEDRDLSGSEDWELWLRIAAYFRIAHVPDNFTRFRLHDRNSTMVDPQASERSIRKALERVRAEPLLQPFLPEDMGAIYGTHLIRLAMIYLHAGRAEDSKRLLREARQHDQHLAFRLDYWKSWLKWQIGPTRLEVLRGILRGAEHRQ